MWRRQDRDAPNVRQTDAAGSHGSSSLLVAKTHIQEFPDVSFDQQIEVKAVRLGDWVKEAGVERIDLLWLDLQGMELAVLKASPEILGVTRVIAMEVSRKELYEGSALYPEVVSWLKDKGFEAVIDRVLVSFGNMLFVRSALLGDRQRF
jgi:hypothetical protein